MALDSSAGPRRVIEITDPTKENIALSILSFGAVADGVTDCSEAFERAINTGCKILIPSGVYYLASSVEIPDGGILDLLGVGTPIIRAAQNVIAFSNDVSYPFGHAHKIKLENIIFDGERVRGTFPYMDASGDDYGMLSAVRASASLEDDNSEIEIHNCTFERMASLPILFDHFKQVTVTSCTFYKTRDPGFRFCNSIRWTNNLTHFGSDNGVSTSRGCKNVVVSDSVFRDCEAAGVWLSGFDVNYSSSGRTATLSGTYTIGATSTLTISGSAFLVAKHQGTYMTLINGSDEAVVKIDTITSSNTATCTNITAIPAALQNSATSSFQEAPHNGVQNFTCTNNVIVGGYSAGVHAGEAPCRGTIAGNSIVRTGYLADSEINTIGTIASGSTTLEVADATGFEAGDKILIEPSTSLAQYYISEISSIDGTTITLTDAPTETFANEPVYLCHENTSGGYAIYMFGQRTAIQRPAQYINITGNMIDEFYRYGIVLGTSDTWPVSDILIQGNSFYQSQDENTATSKYVIHISEAASSETGQVIVQNNFADGTHDRLVNIIQRGTDVRDITVKNNTTTATIITAVDADNSNASVPGYSGT